MEAPDGLPLSVRVEGDGAPLVLLHGFTGSAEAWPEPVWAGLARRWRVIAPDLVGHGASARPHDPDRYAVARVLADVAAVQAALVDGPACWIGYSMGGRVALAGAVLGAAPIRGLILESASPGLEDEDERDARRLADEERARALEEGGIEAFVDAWLAQPLFRTQADLPAEVRRSERERRLAGDPRALAACLRGLGTGSQPPLWDVLGGLGLPVLLLTGERDEKFDRLADAMARSLPDARRARIAGAGHTVHLERPDAWVRAVVEFLADLPRAAS